MALPRVVELFGFAVVVVPRDFVVVVGLPRGFVAVVVLWLVVVTRAFVVVGVVFGCWQECTACRQWRQLKRAWP